MGRPTSTASTPASARNLAPPFSFTCFTDAAEGLRPEVRAEPLPPLDVAMPTGTKGIWPKARLWGERLGDLAGPVLFMDLDLVVVGSLDDFFGFGEPDEVILARNPNTPFERLGQTSIFRFPVGKLCRCSSDSSPTRRRRRRLPVRAALRHPRGARRGRFWPEPWVRHFRRIASAPCRSTSSCRRASPTAPGSSSSPAACCRRTRSPASGAAATGPRPRPSTCAASSPPAAPTRRCATSATTCARRPGSRRRGGSRAGEPGAGQRYDLISIDRAEALA